MSYEAEQLWAALHADPEGTLSALRDEVAHAGYNVQGASDPRMTEMLDDWQRQRDLAQYDATIEAIVNDPANADINPNRLHTFVAAADGDFNRALEMYRADVGQVLQDYGQPGNFENPPALPGETFAPAGYTPDPNAAPRDNLHRAIEEATRAALARRGR